MTSTLPLPALLARIGIENLPPPSAESLFGLLRAYRVAIPFENLDVLAGRTVSTNLEDVVQKIVFEKRGGWCYELNQLFAAVLLEAGFDVTFRLARVGYRRPSLGPLTHLVLQVKTDDRLWLVDAGFGGPGPCEPLPMTEGSITCCDGGRFHFACSGKGNFSLYRWIDGELACIYEISQIEVQPIDLEMSSYFLSTWPRSPFRQQLMCVAFDGERSWSLEGNELLRCDENWRVSERTPIKNDEHLQSILESQFGICIPTSLIKDAWSSIHQ